MMLSDERQSPHPMSTPDDEDSVMGNLPRTRPQRRSGRRPASSAPPTPDDVSGPPPVPPGSVAPGQTGARAKSASGPKATPRGKAAAGAARPGATKSSAGSARVKPSARVVASADDPALRRRARPTAHPHPTPPARPTAETEGEGALDAAGQIARRGLTLGVRALRGAVSRLPRPG